MKFKYYLKDRLFVLLVFIVTLLLVFSLLVSFQPNSFLPYYISFLLLCSFLGVFLIDYFRKKKFYDPLLHASMELDQKYLVQEMVMMPSFYEGKIVYQLLYEANRSMLEKIKKEQQETEDFREYLELWIHEIKIPLSSLLLMLENHRMEDSGQMREELFRMENLMDQVLFYVRSQQVEKDYLIQKVSLKELVNHVVLRNKNAFIYKKITLEMQDLEYVIATDPKWMEFILNQILSNSLKYVQSQKPSITFRGRKVQGGYGLQIIDNGIGIAAADLPRVFDKGFTGMNGRKQYRSTGLGLYLCKQLCDKLGHSISITSILGEKTVVCILFGEDTFISVK